MFNNHLTHLSPPRGCIYNLIQFPDPFQLPFTSIVAPSLLYSQDSHAHIRIKPFPHSTLLEQSHFIPHHQQLQPKFSKFSSRTDQVSPVMSYPIIAMLRSQIPELQLIPPPPRSLPNLPPDSHIFPPLG